MRRIFVLAVTLAGMLLVLACSNEASDSCTGIGGVCVAASACQNDLPYTCNSGVCCSAVAPSTPGSPSAPTSPPDASAD